MSISATFPQTTRTADRARGESAICDRQTQPLNAARGILVAAGLSAVFWVSVVALFV